MLEFYRPHDCSNCADIEDTLRELVIAHRVTVVEHNQTEALPSGTPLPAFKDGDRVISGTDDIALYLRELTKLVADWRRFQGDSCYIDESGEVC